MRQNGNRKVTNQKKRRSPNEDYTIIVDNTGLFTVNLPDASTVEGQILNIKKISATAGNLIVTMRGYGTDQIDIFSGKAIGAQY